MSRDIASPPRLTGLGALRRVRGQRGFDLFQFLLWMALVAVGIGSGAYLYRQNRERNRGNDAVQLLASIRDAMGVMAGNDSTFGTGSVINELVDSGRLPSWAVVNSGSTKAIRTPWRAAVTVTTADTTYTVTFPGLPKAACLQIAVGNGGASGSEGILNLSINGTAITLGPGQSRAAAAACTVEGGGTSGNAVVWEFDS